MNSGTATSAVDPSRRQLASRFAPVPGKLEKRIVTPEGAILTLQVARSGDRIGAFTIDMLIAGGSSLLLLLLGAGALGELFSRSWWGAAVVFTTFLITNLYFVWLEYRWQGVTIGKRATHIRVTDVNGGALTGDAVLARNLTRHFEVILPLQGLLLQAWAWPGAPGWIWAFGGVWLIGFGILPFLNREHRRVGDLIAGTIVVEMPRVLLLDDLGAPRSGQPSADEPAFDFTTEQLDVYGIYELQVLEELLRRGPGVDPQAIDLVCEKIKRKIGWDRTRWDVPSRPFLEAFYAVQRARLEQKLLLGRRQEHKREGVAATLQGEAGDGARAAGDDVPVRTDRDQAPIDRDDLGLPSPEMPPRMPGSANTRSGAAPTTPEDDTSNRS